jgi:hypothetical protein
MVENSEEVTKMDSGQAADFFNGTNCPPVG